MGLSDFRSGDKATKGKYHENPVLNKKRLHDPDVCPSCGEPGIDDGTSGMKCPQSLHDCDTIRYFSKGDKNARV